MSINKTAQSGKASEPVRQRPKTGLRLLKPQSECSTTDLISELSQEVKVMLRGQKRRRKGPAGDEPPKAA